ncbi:MAG: hypothetical protein GC168_03255 [Candidatus Hydrogenedens sp.]|nr:hypothetical protein [Candidatus Hydrogenedens sp.]
MKTRKDEHVKDVKNYIYEGCGFPVRLSTAKMFKVGTEWVLDIDYAGIERSVAATVARKPSRLTGNEVRFLRQFLAHSLKRLADHFAYSAPAVLKWEQRGDKPTGMHWAVEKDLRLLVLQHLGESPSAFLKAYKAFEVPMEIKPGQQQYEIVRRGGKPVARCA